MICMLQSTRFPDDPEKMKYIIYAIGSRFVYEVDEIVKRNGATVSAYVANQALGWLPDDLKPVVRPDELQSQYLRNPVIIPLITPGHRKSAYQEAKNIGLSSFPSLRDSSAIIASSSSISDGTIVNAGVVVGAKCQFAEFTLINRSCSIGHDVKTEEFVTFGPGSVVAGSCVFKRGTFIGAGATILPECTVGSNSVIGAGAVVVRDVPDNTVVVGNPARVVKSGIAGFNDTTV